MLVLAEIFGTLICKQTIDSLMLEILRDTHARIWPSRSFRTLPRGSLHNIYPLPRDRYVCGSVVLICDNLVLR